MEAGAPMVSYSIGAMNSLLDKLTNLKNPPKLIEGLQQDLVSLKEDFVDKFAGRGERDGQVKAWMKQVRELVYDIEDWIDPKPATELGGSEREEEIKEFKALIQQARDRCERYGLLSKSPTDPDLADVAPSEITIDSGLLLGEKIGCVVLEGPMIKLVVEHLSDKQKMLKVVSVVGMEGLGKTTLAKEIYGELQGQFDCHAFVSVGRRPSMKTTLMDILRQVKPEAYARDGSEYSDVQQVITELREYLGTKRYFILVDGIWSTWDWKVINCALPDENVGSRVLATTCIIDVAKSCSIHPNDVVYRMEALSEDDSRSLFRSRVSVGEEEWPADFNEISDNILKRCGGMPLAIIVTASLLHRKSAELGQPIEMLGKSIVSSLDPYSTSQVMKKILDMSHADLSLPVKSCFLYLSVFPENYVTNKDRLIRLWEAEGLIPRRERESLWETGESYFNELIRRRLIQPVVDYDYDQAVGCTVHGVILDFIGSLSIEENFATTAAELSSGPFSCDPIRRLTLNCCSNKDADDILASSKGHLSCMRSLTVFGDIEAMPALSAFKLVRVLDLEDADNLSSHHLEGIEGLVLLRYLGLGGTGIHHLPERIGELEHLETLDLRRTNLITLPASAVKLRKLVRLLLDGALKPHTDFSLMKQLEEVSTIGVNRKRSLQSVVKLLSESERLRLLGVSLAEGLLGSLLEDSPFQHRRLEHLQRFELTICGLIFGGVPRKMAFLVELTHLDIGITEVEAEGVSVLGGLPNLVLLKLQASPIASLTSFLKSAFKNRRCIISREGFGSLKVFWFTCKDGVIGLEFTPGAMPKLRRLQLSFRAALYGDFDFGIQHLTCLKLVHASIDCYLARASKVKAAENAIREQVSQIPNEPTLELSREHGHRLLEGQGNMIISAKKMAKKLISKATK